MGYFDQDTLEMLDVYLLETLQLLDKLDEVLLEAEKNRSFSGEDINSIFRIMHTIKSSSAMMGLAGLSELAHSLEDLFSMIRDDIRLSGGRESGIFNLLFGVSDFVREEAGRMRQEGYQPGPVEKMEAEIRSLLTRLKKEEQGEEEPKEEEQKEKEPGEKDPGQKETRMAGIRVFFEKDCKMENIRAFMLLRQIRARFPQAESVPADPEKEPRALQEIKENGFLILVEPSQSAEVLEVIRGGLFVSRCETDEAQAEKKEEPQEKAPKVEAEYLNVRMDRLDHLQNLTGELLLSMSSLRNGLKKSGCQDLDERFGHSMGQLFDELENTVTDMRMIPVSQVVPKLKRIVRDMGNKQKKKIDLVVTGEDVDADKNIVERIYEAAVHVIRNAADHGIELPGDRAGMGKPETGRIEFDVKSAGGEMIVSIRDDGRGMNEEMLRQRARENHLFTKPEEEYTAEEIYELSTLPGLSTKESANEYSGRGVGMDIVRKQAEDIGGSLKIRSREGEGTEIILTLPLTCTIVQNVQFRAAGRAFEIPSRQADRFLRFDGEDLVIRKKGGRRFAAYEKKILPIIDVGDFYGLGPQKEEQQILIHIRTGDREACLLADQILGEEKVVLKPLPLLFGPMFRRRTGMNGCSIMGSGEICLSLDGEILTRLVDSGDGRGRRDGE